MPAGLLPFGVRKNLILTVWLALPILVFAGLVVWIFASMGGGGERPEPIGPGAGDTGGANAIGEWLAGRNPDDVERANIARRQGASVDPFGWPGGTRVEVEAPDAGVVSVGWVDPDTGLLRAVALRRAGDGLWAAVLKDNRPPPGTLVFVSDRGLAQQIREGRREVVDDAGALLLPQPVAPAPVEHTAASAPLTVRLSMPD